MPEPDVEKRDPALIYVGTAGWSIPTAAAVDFSMSGSHLLRYASRLNAVEINSSFYRPHRTSTYERWAASTPSGFRFSVKVPKQITHERRLSVDSAMLDEFHQQVSGLGTSLGCLLVQLPPSLAFEVNVSRQFFERIRQRFVVPIVLEPRHATWFTDCAAELLENHEISRVGADPAIDAKAAVPVPSRASAAAYWRLHGSPKRYYSGYDASHLRLLADQLKRSRSLGIPCWCIFDNTAEGAAIRNALELVALLDS